MKHPIQQILDRRYQLRNPARILPLLMRVAHAWMRVPDQRLGQLLTNTIKSDDTARMFYLEDEDFVEKIEEYAKQANSVTRNYAAVDSGVAAAKLSGSK